MNTPTPPPVCSIRLSACPKCAGALAGRGRLPPGESAHGAAGPGGALPVLELICGRAGAGKTWHCLTQAEAALVRGGPDGAPLVLLTPEQATHQMERALLQRRGAGAAVVRLEVLSFQRLALRILAERGGSARPHLHETGRRMLIRALLRARRADLTALGAADRPGLVSAVAAVFAEFWAYGVQPDDLRGRLAAVPAAARQRLADLALLWEAYLEAMRQGPADPASELAAAAAAAGESELAAAEIWVDGFAGFTPAEENLLSALVTAGAQVHVALCLDGHEPLPGGGPDDPAHPFAPTRRTLARLLRRHPGATVLVLGEAGGTPPRFRPGSALAQLEAGLWADEPPPPEEAVPQEVRLVLAADPRAEAEAAADEMDRLCREEGYRYGEMAVILRDMETYHDLVARACARRGIPVFVDRRRPAQRHPLFTALAAALAVITSAWRLEAVLHYLRSGLTGLAQADADVLENWALATGMEGTDWTTRALVGARSGPAPDQRARPVRKLNALRRQLTGPLQRLAHRLAPTAAAPPSAAAAADALAEWFAAVGAEVQVEAWAVQAEAAGRLEEGAWHRGCLRAAGELLDELAASLGERPLDAAELASVLDSAVADLTVGLIPPGLDQVLCGAVERSRQPELRAAFVLGMRDGAFPPVARESALVPDADRLALRQAGLELGPTTTERLLAERYLGYIALTRASQRLYLSAPASPGPADLFTRAAQCLGVAASPWPTPPEPTARRGVTALAGQLAAELRAARDGRRPPAPGWAEADAWLAADPARERVRTRALAGLAPRAPAGIAPEVAAALYPPVGSVTRLESLAACPFQHFARHGLRLQPRELAEVRPTDLGHLLHAALADFVRSVLRDGLELADLTPEDTTRRADQALAGARAHVTEHLPPRSRRADVLLEAAGRDMRLVAATLVAHARAGEFRPVAVEMDFAAGTGVGAVRGRIDRIDAATGPDGRRCLRVVDYKTGRTTFSLDDFLHGLNLQPVLYLFAALGSEDVPGGFFLLHVRAQLEASPGPVAEPAPLPRLSGYGPAEPEWARLHERELDGGVTGIRWKRDGQPYGNAPVAANDQFALLRQALARQVERLARRGAAGDVAVAPYRRGTDTACAHCELLAVCGFDPGAGDRHRWLAPKDAEIWDRLRAEVQDGGAVDG